MKIVIFGLSVSSSWGNGHATLWRGLCAALAARGHTVVFFERDMPWYALHRDLWELPGGSGTLVLYPDWEAAKSIVRRHLEGADVALCTSYCPDAIEAERAMLESRVFRVFYDLDAPVTLERLRAGEMPEYLAPHRLAHYELTLSYAGGPTLAALQREMGARRVAPLYGSVDPAAHRPVASREEYAADLSYLGTYAPDRQESLARLFLAPAEASPARRFALAGAQYPAEFPWKANLRYFPHLSPDRHGPFFCSSRITLNVTRRAMAAVGYCPSGRLFEAAACGAAILTDEWEGLGAFFEPGAEILAARGSAEVLEALEMPERQLRRIGKSARERVLDEHTAAHRAAQLEALLEGGRAQQPGALSGAGAA